MKAGVAISPDTPASAITDQIAEAADMLLVMTVYPGKKRSYLFIIYLHFYRLFQVEGARSSWIDVCQKSQN